MGRVNPVPNVASGQFIGASIRGSVDVKDDGSASYRFPLWVPEGVHGMQPSLSIAYGSEWGPGILGPKWHLTGLSQIVRCRATLSQDGAQGPIDPNNGDAYCLDDDRLVRVSGSPKGTGEFRTETNPFQRIVATQADSAGVLTFQVFQPDGRVFYYGRTAASRLNLAPLLGEFNYVYYLDTIEDRYGNSILIQYTSQFVTPAFVQELFPSQIQWGGQGDTPGVRSIQFDYQPAYLYNPLSYQRFVAGFAVTAGERLTGARVYGPDASGSPVLLKQYTFSYTTATITGERLLQSLTECDPNNVCKHPTNITWEPGASSYSRTLTGILNPVIPAAPAVTVNTKVVNLSDVYRRIIAVDLNNDGLDDIVYRDYTGPGGNTCLSWVAQYNTSAGSIVSFGPRVILPVGNESDPSCNGDSTRYPYSGDPIFVDYNLDGYPDLLVAQGDNGLQNNAFPSPDRLSLSGYHLYMQQSCPVPGNTTACMSFGGTSDIDDPTQVNATSPWLSVGDINGDGFPDILRPKPNSTGLHWITLSGASGDILAMSGPLAGFQLMDLDGDGTSEVVRDEGSDARGVFTSQVTSPTINAISTDIPPINPGQPPQFIRWLLDLNGDGLVDIAYVDANSPNVINTRLNLGASGFRPSVQTTLPQGWAIGQGWRDGFESGVRIVDFNRDGRQDLVLVDNGATPGVGATRSSVVALLSDGVGGFTLGATGIPVGDYADGAQAAAPAASPVTPASHGYRTSVTLDLNGDGLPDFLQLEGGLVVAYVRRGKQPDMVTRIVEGTGRSIYITYAPESDPTVYTNDPQACFASSRLSCLTRGRWLPKQINEFGLGSTPAKRTRYTYTGGLFDRFGRGFLGFERRDIYVGSSSQHTSIAYNPKREIDWGGPIYDYPWAFKPLRVTIDTDTLQGPNSHHQRIETFRYSADTLANDSRFTSLILGHSSAEYDCPGNGTGVCTGALRLLSEARETYAYDPLLSYNALGRPTTRQIVYLDQNFGVMRTDVESVGYAPFDPVNWLMPATLVQSTSTSATVSPPEAVTRTIRYTQDPSFNAITGLLTGDVATAEFEPSGDVTTHRVLTTIRDARGRVSSVADAVAFPTSATCNSSCTPTCNADCQSSCAGGDPNVCGSCIGSCMGACMPSCLLTPAQSRSVGFQYEDADGVYVTTVTNALGQTSRTWRHPGLGLVVEEDDPNLIASTASYDTFGRLLSQTAASGATTTFGYADQEDPLTVGGVDVTILPEGSVTRQVSAHLDSFGRETNRVSPVDANRAVSEQTTYDPFGRVAQRSVFTGSTTSQTTIGNQYSYTYDDLNRLTSDCHVAADNTNQCNTWQYDGLSVTATDESGRSVTRIADPMGRPSVQRVVQSGGTVSDATFAYGAFGLLEHERLSDGSGQTDIGYDVLGRQTSIARTGAGVRGTSYNAYGNVVGSYKLSSDGLLTQEDNITYGRDPLGRLTSAMGAGVNRTIFWDQTSTGAPAPYAIGKPVDVFDGNNHVQMAYNANGLLMNENWSLSLFGQPATSFGGFTFFYDPQGRLRQQIYPRNLSGVYNGLHLVYSYDPYLGTVSWIADAANRLTPLWAASSRNERGQVTGEALTSPSAVAMTKSNSYSPFTGQLISSQLAGANPSTQWSQLTYAYQADGLPNTTNMDGVGGSWMSSFGYDNLKRLTAWGPSNNVSVGYQYDSDGNMTQRNWGSPGAGASVTFASTFSALTVSGGGSNIPSFTDTYQVDQWGRIYDTPTTSLSYNANDEVGSVVEKANGEQVDSVVHDGFGQRVATTYGVPTGNYSYLLTFMNDLYEFRYTSSTNTSEERCRFYADGKVVGDVVRTASNAPKTVTYYLTDNVGSVMAEASDSGVVTARARRDPFGNLIDDPTVPDLPAEPAGTDPDGSSRLGFGAHEREPGWGLVDMHARFYSPRLGRFASPDSTISNWRDRRSYNPFAYSWDNPVAMFDPNGHQTQLGGVITNTYNPSGGSHPSVPEPENNAGSNPDPGPGNASPAGASTNTTQSGGSAQAETAGPSTNPQNAGPQGSGEAQSSTSGLTPGECDAIADAAIDIMLVGLAATPLAPVALYYGLYKAAYAYGQGDLTLGSIYGLATFAGKILEERFPWTAFWMDQAMDKMADAVKEARETAEHYNSQREQEADAHAAADEAAEMCSPNYEDQAAGTASGQAAYDASKNAGPTGGQSGTDPNQGTGGQGGSSSQPSAPAPTPAPTAAPDPGPVQTPDPEDPEPPTPPSGG